jgi:hypothetical protein
MLRMQQNHIFQIEGHSHDRHDCLFPGWYVWNSKLNFPFGPYDQEKAQRELDDLNARHATDLAKSVATPLVRSEMPLTRRVYSWFRRL